MSGYVSEGSRLRRLLVAPAVGISGLLLGGILTGAAVLSLDALGVTVGPAVVIVVSLVATQGVAFGSVALLYLRHRELPLEFVGVQVPSLRDWIWTGSGYVLTLLAAVTAAAFVAAASAPRPRNQVTELAIQQPSVLLLMIPASFLLVGPAEELLFRGIVQGTLREAFGPAGAIVLASGIFAGIHVLALTGSPSARIVGVAVLFLPSLVLGTAYERTGNLIVPALIHGGYNATLFTILYVSIQFGPGL